MRILLLATNYPNLNGGISLFYIHTRSIIYVKNGLQLDVLNFSANEDYVIDGVNVITLDTYKKNVDNYDLLISHAPNLRLHYVFLKKYGKYFKKYIFFFHGHEVLMTNKVYSKPYDYMKKKGEFLKNVYDFIKLKIWKHFFIKNNYKSYYIFVSNWMKEQFLKWTRIDKDIIENRFSITYNGVGEIFEKERFNDKCNKEYDFVTIRNNLDGSKYSIDIVNKLAYNTPNKKFLIVGKGQFFKHYNKAPNITWLDTTMNHQQIIETLNKCKFALMPTRTDAQGLMMCEMAAFGIPVITSDLPVCHEVFNKFENVYYIDNDDNNSNLNEYNNSKSIKHEVYYKSKTINKEISMINKFLKDK